MFFKLEKFIVKSFSAGRAVKEYILRFKVDIINVRRKKFIMFAHNLVQLGHFPYFHELLLSGHFLTNINKIIIKLHEFCLFSI